uniref:hypothetical protein n=1 Tax=Amycolatopsis sp. CA-096443 TaxID=3239919 RepID=UPI003F4985E6
MSSNPNAGVGAACDANCGDYRAVCSDCDREHDSIGSCVTCGHLVSRHCDGGFSHQCRWTAFQRDHGPHRAVLAPRS